MKEYFVTYDLAVKLKEKGFRECVRGHYKSECHLSVCSEPMNCNGFASGDISAPQIHEVLKWLREGNKIYIMIDRSFAMNNSWHYYICVDDDFENIIQQKSIANKSWEQSALDAIEYVVDNLM